MARATNPIANLPGAVAAPRATQRRLRPVEGRPKLLLTVHVLATVGVFGADLVLVALGVSSLIGAEPRTVYPAARLVAANVVAPLALFSLGTGVLLAWMSGWGLFRYWWVTIKLAITLTLTLVVLTVLVPRLSVAADAATGPAVSSPSTVERMPVAVAPAVASALLVVNVALAVYKPTWRLRPDAGARPRPTRSDQAVLRSS